jgi:hypothetical protein
MKSSRFPLILGGGIAGAIALLMLANGVMFAFKGDASWLVNTFAISLPAMLLLGAALCLKFLDGLQDHWIASTFAQYEIVLSLGLVAAFTAAAPSAVEAVYSNLDSWLPFGIFALLGEKPAWTALQILAGLWLLCDLGISMADDEQPLPFLLVRTLCMAAIIYAWLPFLHYLGWITPTKDFPMPLFVFFCALYYPIMLLIRFIMTSEDEISMLLGASAIGAVGIIPYFFIIYLLSGLFILLYTFVLGAWAFVTQYTWLTILFLFCFLGISPFAYITKDSSGRVTDTYVFSGFEGVSGFSRVIVVIAIIALIIFGVRKCAA